MVASTSSNWTSAARGPTRAVKVALALGSFDSVGVDGRQQSLEVLP
jgi:hypothetical protein